MNYRTVLERVQQEEIIQSLPKAIRASISRHLLHPAVERIYLFQGVSNGLLSQLVAELKVEYFSPREDVILQNEEPTDFYIFVSGSAELIVEYNAIESVISQANSGDVVGEIGVLCYKPQPFTVRTTSLSQIMRLSRTAFLNLAHSNVGDATIIMTKFLEHLAELRTQDIGGVLHQIQTMLALDLLITTCFAVNANDDALLNRLLKKKGSDPNEADNHGRTALHIAASRGSVRFVSLLLEHGADPNRKDREGNVPLWEAVRGRHAPVVEILVNNGAAMDAASLTRLMDRLD